MHLGQRWLAASPSDGLPYVMATVEFKLAPLKAPEYLFEIFSVRIFLLFSVRHESSSKKMAPLKNTQRGHFAFVMGYAGW